MCNQKLFKNEIKEHFEKIAPNYDNYKKYNWYYYYNLLEKLKEQVPANSQVLDIGSATGELLNKLEPDYGLGIDNSEKMIKLAKEKFKQNLNLEFKVLDFEEEVNLKSKFDYIILVDVLEHFVSLSNVINNIDSISHNKSKIIILNANYWWQPLLLFLEKIKLKMPEGPHQRKRLNDIIKIFNNNNFKIVNKDYTNLFPFYLPFFSKVFNRILIKFWLFQKIALTQIIIFKKNDSSTD